MSNFQTDLEERGQPAEYLTVELFRASGIPTRMNEADDYAGLASHDILVTSEPWDVKADSIAPVTKRIFVERKSLQKTRSKRFCYWIPSPYGYDMYIFLVSQLIELYNAKQTIRRPDGSVWERWLYQHGVAGDQPDNEGVFIPMDVVKKEALRPYQVSQELRKAA